MSAEDLLEKGAELEREIKGEPQPEAPHAEPEPQPEPETQADNIEREIAGTFAMFGAGLGRFLPSVRAVLDEAACEELGRELAPVARKYDLASWFGAFKWKEEFRAAMILVPTVMALRQAIEHDVAIYRAQAQPEHAGAGDAPMSGTTGGPSGEQPAPASNVEVLKPIEPRP